MGLDMSLYRETTADMEIKNQKLKDILETGEDRYGRRVDKQEVCYWRKFNALHKYFADHFGDEEKDNCVNMYMEITDIENLLSLLKKLKSKIKLGDGDVENGYTCSDNKLNDTVLTESGSVKASELQNGDIIIRHNGEETERCRVSDIRKDDKSVRYKATTLVKGKLVLNPEICEMLLPTEEGFFFGSTDYDQWYVEDIENTIPMLEQVIKEHKKLVEAGVKEYDIDYYYRAWY